MPKTNAEALLLSRDSRVTELVRQVTSNFGINLRLAPNSAEALDLAIRKKFEAIILDCDEDKPEDTSLLSQIRQGKSNRTAIVFAILGESSQPRALFQLGANFILQKPLSSDHIVRSFRAAVGLMARDRQRYRRVATSIPVLLRPVQGSTQHGTITNLSERGMAVHAAQQLTINAKLLASFTLSDGYRLKLPVQVVWSRDDGHAGCRLLVFDEGIRARLKS